MSNQKRLDKIAEAAIQSMQEEVSALIGSTLTSGDSSFSVQTKAEIFDEIVVKQVFATVGLEGDENGTGCLLMPVKAAIRLGGTLIMLPPGELDEVVADEVYNEETQDSYGEIANIITGVYSKYFEEMFPKSIRLVRKELQVLAPANVDVESGEPIAAGSYYVICSNLELNGNKLGECYLILPAEPLGLVQEEQAADVEEVSEESAAEEQKDTVSSDENERVATAASSELEAETEAEPEENSVQPEEVQSSVAYDPKNEDKLKKILDETQRRIGEEVSGLIGTDIELIDSNYSFLSKEAIFNDIVPKQIAAGMDIRGDIEGQGVLLVNVKDGIRLGGTLIMLPQTELEEVVGREEYNDEIEDSYGEIANIIAGSYSKVLEEMFPKSCRIIRKELTLIQPVKVDISSDEPVPDGIYYVVKNILVVSGTQCGEMIMLLPAETFGLMAPEEKAEAEQQASQADIEPPAIEDSSEKDNSVSEVSPDPVAEKKDTRPPFDSEKQKKIIDKLLGSYQKSMKDELSAMLGGEVELTDVEKRLVSKEDFFFDEASGKQVLAYMDVLSDQLDDKGQSYLFVELKDAIRMGGTLIMLPPSELDSAVLEEDFNADCEDAYGEIANIMAGTISGVFEEDYLKKFRFVRKELEHVVPMKVDSSSPDPVPDVPYYLHSMVFHFNGEAYGKVQVLYPAELVQLDRLGEKTEESAPVKQAAVSATANNVNDSAKVDKNIDVILMGNDHGAMAQIMEVLEQREYRVKKLSLADNIYDHIHDGIQTVFLVMQEVNEVGFGVAIKISTATRCPLIAAGPGWTKTKVIKAVKYGVTDILLTPTDEDDIGIKIQNNLVKLAA